MTNELELAKSNLPDAIKDMIMQANSSAGVSIRNSMPNIPSIKINNKSEEKDVVIDGMPQKVKYITEGFLINKRNSETKKYETEYFSKTLSGVILKRRFKIISKNDTEPRYYSEEFDSWNQVFKVYTGSEILFEGTYAEAKEMFKTGINPRTKKMDKSFDTYLVLYLNVQGQIYKYEQKMTGVNKWFDYEAEFKDDTFVRYETHFLLHLENKGDINFYYVEFKKGNEVDLAEQLEFQKQVNGFLNIKSSFKSTVNKEDDFFSVQPEQPNDEEVIDITPKEEHYDNSIPISAIPF